VALFGRLRPVTWSMPAVGLFPEGDCTLARTRHPNRFLDRNMGFMWTRYGAAYRRYRHRFASASPDDRAIRHGASASPSAWARDESKPRSSP
jgi:hypothetical protein